MMPWKRIQLTSTVVAVFNGLAGEARAKAIATGNYDKLIAEQQREVGQPQREPGQDDEEVAA